MRKLFIAIWTINMLLWSIHLGFYIDYRLRYAELSRHCGQEVNGTYAYCGGDRPINQVFMDLTEPPVSFWSAFRIRR